MKKLLLLTATVFFIQISNAQTDSIGYFGQTPPGDSAVVFAPGILSLPNRTELNISFSPNGTECFFTVTNSSFSDVQIYYTKCVNKIWTPQVLAPFSLLGNWNDAPLFSADGNKIYFCSNRNGTRDIWMVERTSQGWGNPQVLPSPINSAYNESHYNQAPDGIIYFYSDRPGSPGGVGTWGLWQTLPQQPGQPLQVENMGSPWNSGIFDGYTDISPDGSYLVYVSIRSSISKEDIYVTFAKGNGGWTAPVNCSGINTGDIEISPYISHDGRYLFFSRLGDIYWVSTHYIDRLKHSNFIPYVKSIIPNKIDTVGHLFSYTVPDSTFIDDDGNNTLTYSATLSNGNPLPSGLHFDSLTRAFSGIPDTAGTFKIKVTATDTAKASVSTQFTLTIKD